MGITIKELFRCIWFLYFYLDRFLHQLILKFKLVFLIIFLVVTIILFNKIDGDSIRLYQHDQDKLKLFDIINTHILYVIKDPRQSHIRIITHKNIDSFIQEQLKVFKFPNNPHFVDFS